MLLFTLLSFQGREGPGGEGRHWSYDGLLLLSHTSLQVPIYQVLEKTEDSTKKPSCDLEAPPIPPYCPSGEDSPRPGSGLVEVVPVEHAEIQAHAAVTTV